MAHTSQNMFVVKDELRGHQNSFLALFLSLYGPVQTVTLSVASSAKWEQGQKRPHRVAGRTESDKRYKPVSMVPRAQ